MRQCINSNRWYLTSRIMHFNNRPDRPKFHVDYQNPTSWHYFYLISSKYTEWIDDLFCCVHIGRFSGHKVQEAIELNIAASIGIHNWQDTLEIDFTLFVLAHGVAQWDETRLEFIGCESSGTRFVKVIEGGTELIELFLGDAFGVTGQDLVLNLVDGPVDAGDQLFPSHAQGLHGVLSVTIFENKGFLDLLVDPFQFFQVGFELVDGLLVLAEPGQLVLQGALKKYDLIICVPISAKSSMREKRKLI